jgi:hypothetical protein
VTQSNTGRLTRTIPLGPDLELRVRPITDPASVGDAPELDVRCYCRARGSGEMLATHEGLRVPLTHAGAIAEVIQTAARAACQHLAMTPARTERVAS